MPAANPAVMLSDVFEDRFHFRPCLSRIPWGPDEGWYLHTPYEKVRLGRIYRDAIRGINGLSKETLAAAQEMADVVSYSDRRWSLRERCRKYAAPGG